MDKGKEREAQQQQAASNVEEGGEEGNVDEEDDDKVRRPQKLSAAHDYCRRVTENLLLQMRLKRPEAI